MFGLKEVPVGDRKWALTLYLIEVIILIAIAELGLYLLFVYGGKMEHKNVLDLFDMLNYFILVGIGGSAGIFVGGNVFEWKYRSKNFKNGGREDNNGEVP